MRCLVAVWVAVLVVLPTVVFAQEVVAAPAIESEGLFGDGSEAGLSQIVGVVIAAAFAWLSKRAVGKAWLQALLDSLEVGVNSAWEEYVKEKKRDGGRLAEDEKQTARELALTRAKSVMGIGAKILLATTPQARVAALISGIVSRRKREAS